MENLNKRPSKGILRFSEGSSRSNSVEKDIKWDETNIKETLHPDDKDYGFMRIDEPPTPYSRSPGYLSGENSDDEDDMQRKLNKTNDLLERVSKKIKEPPVTIDVDDLLDAEVLESIEKDNPMDTTNGSLPSTTSNSDFAACSSSGLNQSSASQRARFLNDPVTSSSSVSNDIDADESAGISHGAGSSSTGAASSSSGGGGGGARNDFELKRKRHYNEFHAVKLAKKLMEKELDDEDEEDDDDEDEDDDEEGGGNTSADNNDADTSGNAEASEAQPQDHEHKRDFH